MILHTLGRYEIRHELGRGGMAIVYLGYDPRIEREVAIKVLPRQFSFDPQFEARFQREVRAIATLEHGAIVPVYDFGEVDDQPFIVMRYMSGGSLAARLRGGHLGLPEAARILARIGPALDRAHAQGIIHRDLKPGNILFDREGEAYLSDFGIAKLADTTAAYTGSALIGTPAYMSPEQARGEANVDGRSDVYSLGVILFETLAGRPPYAAATPMGIAMRHVTDPVPRIRQFNPRLPKQVERAIRRAMAKSPQDRYQTAAELAGALSDEAWKGREEPKWTPAIASDTLAGQIAPDDLSGAPAETAKVGEPEEIPASVDRRASPGTLSREQTLDRRAKPSTLGRALSGDRRAQPGRLRRVPRWALVGGALLGFLMVGAAFAAGVSGGGTRTPTPMASFMPAAGPTQNALVVPTRTPRPSSTPTSPASPTMIASATATFLPRATPTDLPAGPPHTPTPVPSLPATDTPDPTATDISDLPPTCPPPEFICEPQ